MLNLRFSIIISINNWCLLLYSNKSCGITCYIYIWVRHFRYCTFWIIHFFRIWLSTDTFLGGIVDQPVSIYDTCQILRSLLSCQRTMHVWQTARSISKKETVSVRNPSLSLCYIENWYVIGIWYNKHGKWGIVKNEFIEIWRIWHRYYFWKDHCWRNRLVNHRREVQNSSWMYLISIDFRRIGF